MKIAFFGFALTFAAVVFVYPASHVAFGYKDSESVTDALKLAQTDESDTDSPRLEEPPIAPEQAEPPIATEQAEPPIAPGTPTINLRLIQTDPLSPEIQTDPLSPEIPADPSSPEIPADPSSPDDTNSPGNIITCHLADPECISNCAILTIENGMVTSQDCVEITLCTSHVRDC